MENMKMENMQELLVEELDKVSGGNDGKFRPLPDSPEFKAYVEYRNYLLKKYNTTIGSMLQKIATPEEWAKFIALFEAYRRTEVND